MESTFDGDLKAEAPPGYIYSKRFQKSNAKSVTPKLGYLRNILETAPQGIEAPKGAQNMISRSGVRLNFLVFYSTPEALEPFSGKRRGFCSINPLELSKVHPDFIFYEDRV